MIIVGAVVVHGCRATALVALLFSRECWTELFFCLLCSERLLDEFFITFPPVVIDVALGVVATDAAALLKAVPLAAVYGTFSSKLLLLLFLLLLVTAPAVLFGMKI